MILKLLLNSQMIWMMFTKILKQEKQETQSGNAKNWLFFMMMIADMLSNRKLNPKVTELIKGRKLSLNLFLLHILFCGTKNIRLHSRHYFHMKIPNKGELQHIHLIIHQILTLHTLWIFTKKCTVKLYSF